MNARKPNRQAVFMTLLSLLYASKHFLSGQAIDLRFSLMTAFLCLVGSYLATRATDSLIKWLTLLINLGLLAWVGYVSLI